MEAPSHPAASTAEVTTCTMAVLRQDPAAIMAEVNSTGRPALVTDGGRFIAMISPLRGVPVENILLQSLAGHAALTAPPDAG